MHKSFSEDAAADDFGCESSSHGGEIPVPILSPRFTAALRMGVALHRNQARKGTRIPYASHLLSVAALVLEHGASEDEAIAAVLHDAIEDQSGEKPEDLKQKIAERFGPAVLANVEACSDASSSAKKPCWKARKEAYIDHLATKSRSARLVSLADKAHNARAILHDYLERGEALWERFNGKREGTLWYYRALVEAFRADSHPRLFSQLEATVLELERRSAAAQAAKNPGTAARAGWWIDKDVLLASGAPGIDQLAQRRADGFSALVSLLEEDEQPWQDAAAAAGWSVFRIPIAEGGIPSIDQMHAFVDLVSEAAKTLVCCATGLGRSALMGAAYWVCKGLSASAALEFVARAADSSEWITKEREALLRQYEGLRFHRTGPGSHGEPLAPSKCASIGGGHV